MQISQLQNRKRYEPYRDLPDPVDDTVYIVSRYKTASGMNPIATWSAGGEGLAANLAKVTKPQAV